jgi:DNA-binding CsgD family transcriptional regulator/PAS domain-containing protein
LNELVAGIYEAGVNPDLWDEVMPRVSGLLGDAGVAFGVVNFQRGLLLFPEHNFDSCCMKAVSERFYTVESNPGARVAVSTAPMTVASLESVVSRSELARMDFYNDLLRPQGLEHGLLGNIYRDRDNLVALASYRPASAGDYRPREAASLAMLMPHFYRSIKVFIRLAAADALLRAGTEIIDRLPQGIIVTDAVGRVGFANSAAEAIIAESDGLRLHNGLLRASRRQESEALSRLIAEAAGVHGRAAVRRTGAMHVSRPSMRQPLPLVVAPMRFSGSSLREALAVSITISDPERLPETTTDTLVRLYGLTNAEAALAVLLLQGVSPRVAADRLGVSINTVRTHIRHLLIKTETERLTDFVRRVMSGPGSIRL